MTEATNPASEVNPYLEVIRAYDKAAYKWQGQVKKIVKRYLDERSDQQSNRLKFNILWANVETLKPAIYAKTPKPEVERRFLDKDPVGRVASEVLERVLDYYLSATPFGSTMRQARMDYLLAGRGVSWVRYVPQFKELAPQITDDASLTVEGGDEAPQEVSWEEVLSDYVHWRDFGHNVARTWEEVSVVWRIVYMTRGQMKKRGFAEWQTIPLDYTDKDMKDALSEEYKKASIYEIWDKAKRKALWLSKSHPRFLDERPDPLELDRFFPCSEPVYATLANETLIPVPDFVEYQDQATEIDELTARIGALTKAIKAAGVYDASQEAVGRLLNEGVQNQLIPVDSWAAMAEKGGLAGAIELLPMESIAKTLLMLYEAREKVKQDLYEVTGMSDIIRGATKASETATAQNLKNNYVTLRLSEKQREMQRFARNTIEIMGNIICRHFQDATIKQVSGVKLFTEAEKQQIGEQQRLAGIHAQLVAQQSATAGGQPQGPASPPAIPEDIQEQLDEPSWDEVLALLRDNPDRCFRIDIETDSTIEMDAAQDRDEAMQFLQAVGEFIKNAQSLPPSMAPLAGSMLEFGVRKWRVGRTLEGVLNKTVEGLEKAAKNPPQTPPDPQMMKVQQDGQAAQAQMQQTGQLEQMKLQAQQQGDAAKLQAQGQIEQAKAALEQHRIDTDAALEQMKAENERQMAEAQLQAEDARERAKAEQTMRLEQWKAELQARTQLEVAEISANTTLQTAQISAASAAAEGEEPKEDKPDPKVDALMTAHKETSEHMKKAVGVMSEAVAAMTRPKKVVRDGAGKLVGVE